MIAEDYKLKRKEELDQLVNKFKYAFYLLGNADSGHNLLRLASFVSSKKPREYKVFVVNSEKTLVFWNP